MKSFKRIISLFLMVVLVMGSTYTNAYASTENTQILADGTIVETAILEFDGSTASFKREISPNGSTVVTIVENGKTYVNSGYINYNHIKDRILGDKIGDGISFLAEEHIANCYHRTLATNHVTITKEEAGVSAAAITAILATRFSSSPKIIKSTATVAYNIFNNSKVAREDITEEVNEVFFNADNVYYTHCYHNDIEAYDDYGHYISEESWSMKYQSVGG